MTDERHAPRGAFGGKALVVSAATLLSRFLALARELLFANLFGATAVGDAYQVGFRIPNLLRDLFAEGALSAAFVPTFTDKMRNEGREAAFRLANVVIGAVLVVVGAIFAAGLAGAPAIVDVIAPKFAAIPGKTELTVELTRLMFPFLPLVSLAAVAMGQLNAQSRFGTPALAPALFNVVAIVTGCALLWAKPDVRTGIVVWSLATVAGGAAQIAVQVPPLYRTGFRFRPRIDFRDPGLRRIALLMAPATIGLAATQVNIVVNTAFASGVPGAVSWLTYAFRLMQLPIGVFGVAVATVAATLLARSAADRSPSEMAATLGRGLRLVAFLTVPCTFGLILLAEPISRLLYERGAFVARDTRGTAAALVFYATGLYCYSGVKVAAPAFYALGRARVPLIASVLAVAANLALNVTLFPVLSYRGLALGTALAATVNFVVLVAAFHRWGAPLDLSGLFRHLGRVLAAAALCGAAAWGIATLAESRLGVGGLWPRMVAVGLAIFAGVVVYVVSCRTLRIAELGEIAAAIRRRLPGG